MKVTSGTYSDGSYGFRAKENGGVMRLWFCGRVLQHGYYTDEQGQRQWRQGDIPCVHTTRREAIECCKSAPVQTE